MEKLTCEICGSDVLIKEEAHFRCAGCGVCYSAQQLKNILDTPAVEEKSVDSQPVQKPKKRKIRKVIAILVAVFAATITLLLMAGFFELLLGQTGVIPRTADAKTNIKSHLEYRIEDENITLESVKFDSFESVSFRSREEDPVGYFAYMDQPLRLTNADGSVSEYENHFEDLKIRVGHAYDPEADTKWAYIATGTYKATHKEHGEILGEFSIVYVCNVSANIWFIISEEYGASVDMLRQDVKNHLAAYLLLTYEIKPNPKIEITSIEKEDGKFVYYTVYGKVTVRDRYGEEYIGKFVSKYQYTSYDHQFRELSTEVDELTRNMLQDLLK